MRIMAVSLRRSFCGIGEAVSVYAGVNALLCHRDCLVEIGENRPLKS